MVKGVDGRIGGSTASVHALPTSTLRWPRSAGRTRIHGIRVLSPGGRVGGRRTTTEMRVGANAGPWQRDDGRSGAVPDERQARATAGVTMTLLR